MSIPFVYLLLRGEGYEFFIQLWNGDICHCTPLSSYQMHKENAPARLSLKHCTELAADKDVVLMGGTPDMNILDIIGAMKTVCEILTHDPDGGAMRIPFPLFQDLYKYLAKVDGDISQEHISTVIEHLDYHVNRPKMNSNIREIDSAPKYEFVRTDVYDPAATKRRQQQVIQQHFASSDCGCKQEDTKELSTMRSKVIRKERQSRDPQELRRRWRERTEERLRIRDFEDTLNLERQKRKQHMRELKEDQDLEQEYQKQRSNHLLKELELEKDRQREKQRDMARDQEFERIRRNVRDLNIIKEFQELIEDGVL